MLPCKPYSGALSKAGYGQRKYRGKMEKAHRVAYAEHHGLSMADIRGKTVRHTCDNPPCCEPTHLLLGDALSNAADRQARGRGAYQRDPTFIPNSTLTAEQVQWVRDNYKPRHPEFGQSAMARKLGVSQALLSATILGKRNITR